MDVLIRSEPAPNCDRDGLDLRGVLAGKIEVEHRFVESEFACSRVLQVHHGRAGTATERHRLFDLERTGVSLDVRLLHLIEAEHQLLTGSRPL